jgi:hypothetical protein
LINWLVKIIPNLQSAYWIGYPIARRRIFPLAQAISSWKFAGISAGDTIPASGIHFCMIRKLKSGEYRLYSRKQDKSTGKRRNLGTFSSLEKAKKHEQEIQYFKKR